MLPAPQATRQAGHYCGGRGQAWPVPATKGRYRRGSLRYAGVQAAAQGGQSLVGGVGLGEAGEYVGAVRAIQRVGFYLLLLGGREGAGCVLAQGASGWVRAVGGRENRVQQISGGGHGRGRRPKPGGW